MNDDLVLTDNEFGLFELMRDGVITRLTRIQSQPAIWRCTVSPHTDMLRQFESKISALDAFMQARVHVIALKLSGADIYSFRAHQKRKELGLE